MQARVSLLLLLILATLSPIGHCQEESNNDQSDTESVWIQAAFWPSRQNDTEPYFEVTWPISGESSQDSEPAQSERHLVMLPHDRFWGAQFTIAETIEKFPEMIAPADVLSLEIRQFQSSSSYAIILEIDEDAFNVTRAVEYIDQVVNSGGQLTKQLLHESSHKFATMTLDMIDFWRYDLRIVPGAIEPGSPTALVASVSDIDMISSSFFNESSNHSLLNDWLSTRQSIWRTVDDAPLALTLATRYMRIVGQYALYAEVVHHGPSPAPIALEFNPDTDNSEIEVILSHWNQDGQLGGRILHVGGGQRRTVSLSTPIWYDGVQKATIVRKLVGSGFHRQLETSLLLHSVPDPPCNVSLMIMEFLPSGAYIDPDEIERLRRFRNIAVSITGNPINIEHPESMSTQNVVFVHLNNVTREDGMQWYNVSVPIHLRYQLPKSGGGFSKVSFPPPAVFVSYSGTEQAPACPKTGTIWPQPFLVESHLQQCPGWHNVLLETFESDPVLRPLEANVPRGNSDSSHVVQLVTFASTVLGACVISVAVWISSRSAASTSGNLKKVQ